MPDRTVGVAIRTSAVRAVRGDVLAADGERAAVGEAAEDLPGRHVEGDVEELGDPVAGADTEAARFGEEEVRDIAVGDLHTVGPAGRAGGEEDVAAVVGADGPRETERCVRVLIRVGRVVRVVVQLDQPVAVGPLGRRHPQRVLRLSEHHTDPGGTDDVAQLGGGGQPDVLGDVRGARLQRAEQTHEHRDRAAYEEADVVAGPHAGPDEPGRQPFGAAVQLGVRDGPALVLGGHGVRRGGGPPFDGVVDQRVGDGDGGALAEPPEKGPVMGGEITQRHGSGDLLAVSRDEWAWPTGHGHAWCSERRAGSFAADCSPEFLTLN